MTMYRWKKIHALGFTLAELLSALAILGVIATFTIPKVLQSSTNGQWNSSAKEFASTISAAYEAYRLENSVTTTFKAADLTPYMNYVRVDTSATIDSNYWGTVVQTCGGTTPCYKLHSGAMMVANTNNMAGTTASHGVWFLFDPDGQVTEAGSPGQGRGKSIHFFLYTTGRMISYGDCQDAATSMSGWAPTCPNGNLPNPDWFSW